MLLLLSAGEEDGLVVAYECATTVAFEGGAELGAVEVTVARAYSLGPGPIHAGPCFRVCRIEVRAGYRTRVWSDADREGRCKPTFKGIEGVIGCSPATDSPVFSGSNSS